MDFLSRVFQNDPDVQAELADRNAASGLSSAIEAGIDSTAIESTIRSKSGVETPIFEGAPAQPSTLQTQTEAVVLWEGRPSLLIRGGRFQLPELRIWRERLRSSTGLLERVIPSVCRIEFERHPLSALYPMIGTGWLVAEDVLVTNRHVAVIFGFREGSRFRFRSHPEGGHMEIRVDFLEEHRMTDADEFGVAEIVHIEDDAGLDMAVLKIATSHPTAEPIVLGSPSQDEMVATIGYPGRDTRVPSQKLYEIFDGKYSVKRLAPGMLMRPPRDAVFEHDCSTLKGSSGSVVVSLATGKAIGLHFAGEFGKANLAVNAKEVKAKLASLSVSVPTAWIEPQIPSDLDQETEESPGEREGYDPEFLGSDLRIPLPGLENEAALRLSHSDATELPYTHFSVVLHESRGLALCAAVNIDGGELRRVPRANQWNRDSRIDSDQQHGNELYRNNPYDRGHLVRRLDPVWGSYDTAKQANADTFFYTNAAPQHKDLNQKLWLRLEDYVLDNADAHDLRISVFTGPVFDPGDPLHRNVQIPRYFWKIVAFADQAGELRASGYLLDQSHLIIDVPEEFAFGAFKTFQVSIDLIARMTGLELSRLVQADVLQQFETVQRLPLADIEDVVLCPASYGEGPRPGKAGQPEKISVEKFREMVTDIDVPDSELRKFVTIDQPGSSAFHPEVRVDRRRVEVPDEESALLLNSMNSLARWRRQKRYHRKLRNGWSGLKVISEGDSWFQYPFILDDVIDQLFEPYAIFSLGAAGDLLKDLIKQDEIAASVAEQGAKACLLSGGGNDLLGGGRLREYLKPYAPGRSAESCLNDRFPVFLSGVIESYEGLIRRLASEFPELHIFCHGYDYAIPNNGRWLGKPMARAGYLNRSLQRRIVAVIINEFNDALAQLVREFPRVHYVDCRGAVGETRWHDELHPTDRGYAAVAARFRHAIDRFLA